MISESAVTNGIQVEVESSYVPNQSNLHTKRFFFSYKVRIKNSSRVPVQLMSRHWLIIDGQGRTEEVQGPGVIGQQPEIQPGAIFEYESFCPLETPTGVMRGSYEMVCLASGEKFNAEIPQFFLVEPNSFH